MGSLPHLAGLSGAASMGTGRLRDQCSPQGCGESSLRVFPVGPALAYSMLFCCHWQDWAWGSWTQACPSLSLPLLDPMSFCRGQSLCAHLLECWVYAAPQGSRLPGPWVEVSLVLLPGSRLAVFLSSPVQLLQAPPFLPWLLPCLFCVCPQERGVGWQVPYVEPGGSIQAWLAHSGAPADCPQPS